jgi:hypothetical protein
MGRVIQDGKMYRRELPRQRLSDIANLSWTKDAVTAAAVRQLQWEGRAIASAKCPENESALGPTSELGPLGIQP